MAARPAKFPGGNVDVLGGDGVVKALRGIARRIPGARFAYRQYEGLALRSKPASRVFSEIYAGNKWGSADSVSGVGSDLDQTRVVRRELPILFRDLGIHTMLDIPCGDFHWMQHTDLHGVDYTGADIVPDLIHRNSENYERSNVQFRLFDVTSDPLPRVDLLLLRDCLVHFSYRDIDRALANIVVSNSTYLLATTFSARERNYDIATGQWRPLNMQVAPILLPSPLRLIIEECTEEDGAFADKSLGLWRVSEINGRG
jgi:methyltransferase family protein